MTSYSHSVPNTERVLTVAAATEGVLLAYAAFVALLTPTGSSENDVVSMLAFCGLALPLAWHVADGAMSSSSRSDPLVLRVLIPNLALLLMCLTGALLGGGSTNNLLVAVTACAALAMTAGAVLVSHARLDAHPADASPRSQQ